MQSISSNPPPALDSRVPPFPVAEKTDRCCLSGEIIDGNEAVIMIPTREPGRKNPVKLSALYAALNLLTEDEKGTFCARYIASDQGGTTLAWYKLMRHENSLFQILLARSTTC